MIASPTSLIGCGLLVLAALGGAYRQGRVDGGNAVSAKVVKSLERAEQARQRIAAAVDDVATHHAAAGTAQATETREIYRETIRIVDRPVYRNQCADADGVQLLDRARANANRRIAGSADGGAAAAASDATER
ncbi:hypothetical protein ABC347_14200 [Sphingomonas sp. 1P06PA]|uniref:hypothetical protein n=1 Tax=Sphingomonas sp. 1P06PA TaxID=554121 RepID=UPI0039A4854A